jgi:parallel beta-helix repeat protein
VAIQLENFVNSRIIQNSITTFSGTNGGNGDNFPEDGIDASYSSNDVISNNTIISNTDLFVSPNNNGLLLTSCFNETVSGNYLYGSGRDISLESTDNCSIFGNSVTQSFWGILLRYSSDNQLVGNNVFETASDTGHGRKPDSGIGFKIYGDDYNNTIYENNIGNNGDGMDLWIGNSGNVIYGNYFQDNTFQVALFGQSGFSNSWENGSVGNYWSDYLTKYPNATEIDHTGLGNTPYEIDQNNTDQYPLWQADINAVTLTPSNSAPLPSSIPTLPEFPLLDSLPLLLTTLSIAVILRPKKRGSKRTK